METFAITHQGLKRRENQDRYFIREFEDHVFLMAVADGMGGEAGGGLAAQIVIEAVEEFTPTDLTVIEASLIKLFLAASRRIEEEVRRDPRLEGMGTTLTAACIKNGITSWAHVGDSRLYLWRTEHLTQITEDHTFVNNLVKQGVITEEEAMVHPMQNILLQCLGCQPIEISTGQFKNSKGDLIFLSTDGLHHEVAGGKIVSVLAGEASVKKILASLIRAALEAGGGDNITLAGAKI